MSVIQQGYGQLIHEDGRVSVEDVSTLADSTLANRDLDPVPIEKRTWGTYNFTALWVGMAHNIPSWTLASGLVAIGMDWKQSVLTIVVANIIVLIPILLNGHAGTKYGIPFPVFVRSSFGVRGANLPAILRALVACAWFGINTWIGGSGIYLLAGKLIGNWWVNAAAVGGHPWTMWFSFAVFLALEVFIILHGMEAVRRFENWAAPVVIAAALALLIWITVKAGGFGSILSEPGTLHGAAFWKVFFPSLMGMIGFWATLSLNISDFTRFGGSQKAQIKGQALGLPTTMTLFALLSVLVTAAGERVWGTAIWDPIELTAKIENPIGIRVALFTVLVASLSVNIAANLVSPAYDFANALPKYITFKRGAIVAIIIGVLIQPWRLIANPDMYIFTWLGFYGGILGPIAGILIGDYWIVRQKFLVVPDLYSSRKDGAYWFTGGWNWRGVVTLVVSALLAIGGSYSGVDAKGVKSGPFPVDGLIPFLKPLADFGWLIGIIAAIVLQVALNKIFPPAHLKDSLLDESKLTVPEPVGPRNVPDTVA